MPRYGLWPYETLRIETKKAACSGLDNHLSSSAAWSSFDAV